MNLELKEFQSACKEILCAVDTSATGSIVNETLELNLVNKVLTLNVTNKEYFVSVTIDVDSDEEFYATVDAKVFLALVSKLSSKSIDLSVENNALVVKGNGEYKIPLVFVSGEMFKLKPITIDNPTSNFVINSDILLSIANYNSKELGVKDVVQSVQNMYYLDNQGAITFTSGACVNEFTLPEPIKLLLTDKVVKLFKLFKPNADVNFTLGYDEVSGLVIAKVKFDSKNIHITSLLNNDESMLMSVPVNAIRGLANNTYLHTVDVNKEGFISALDRLLLFTKLSNNNACKFECSKEGITIYSTDEQNKEFIPYIKSTIDNDYNMILNVKNLKTVLESCKEDYLTLHFGDGKAIVIGRNNVKNVIPEMHKL